MEIEKGLVYSFVFRTAGRLKAAGIAHDLAISRGKNKKKALKQSVNAFLGRPIRVSCEELQDTRLAHIEQQLARCHQNKLLNRVTTLCGVDPVRRRGQSKSLARQTIVRTWPYKGLKHPGHATLSIKDRSPDRARPKHVYFSWWPSRRINSRLNNVLGKLGLDELTTKTARNASAYILDKRDEMGLRTQARLISGAGHHDELENYGDTFSEADKEIAKKKPLKPRVRQVQLRGTHLWGVQADKVYLPMIGPNTDLNDDKPAFSVFGLNEAKMERFTRKQAKLAEEGKATYEMGSPLNSCSGMIRQALKEGGAEHYIKTNDAWFVPDPNMVHAMAVRLQEKVDGLNAKAEALTEAFTEQRGEMVDSGVVTSQWSGIPGSLAFVPKWQASLFPGIPPHTKRQIDAVKKAITGFDGTDITLDKLVPGTIKLVEALEKAWKQAGDDEVAKRALMPGLGAFELMKKYLSKAHTFETENTGNPPEKIRISPVFRG